LMGTWEIASKLANNWGQVIEYWLGIQVM